MVDATNAIGLYRMVIIYVVKQLVVPTPAEVAEPVPEVQPEPVVAPITIDESSSEDDSQVASIPTTPEI